MCNHCVIPIIVITCICFMFEAIAQESKACDCEDKNTLQIFDEKSNNYHNFTKQSFLLNGKPSYFSHINKKYKVSWDNEINSWFV